MCIMEVRPGQRSSTIAQAMAHNLSTIERDLDMFEPLLAARDEPHLLPLIEKGHEAMKVAYACFLEVFTVELAHDIHHHGDTLELNHSHERPAHEPHIHPNDQELIDAAIHAAHDAEKYETR